MRRDAERRETTFGPNGVSIGRARGAPEEGVRPRRVRGGPGRQREVRVREREAALAAEKRLWRRERRARGDESLGRGWCGGDGAATGCVGRSAAGGRGPHARHLPGLGRGRDGLRARGGAAEGVAGRRPPRPVDAELLRPRRVGRLFGRARPPPDVAQRQAVGRRRLRERGGPALRVHGGRDLGRSFTVLRARAAAGRVAVSASSSRRAGPCGVRRQLLSGRGFCWTRPRHLHRNRVWTR